MAQRQDALNDQMFDVMCVLRAADSENPIAAWLLARFFGATAPVTGTRGLPEGFITRLHAARRTATDMGCYDAADWLRYSAPRLFPDDLCRRTAPGPGLLVTLP